MLTIIGMGCGGPGCLTAEARAALEECDVLIGARRLLDAVEESGAERVAEYRPEAIMALLRERQSRRVCVLFSGDPGFYSGAAGLIALLEREALPCRVLPGISSVQMLAARLGLSWQDWRLCSAHGRSCDAAAELSHGQDVFFLTGGESGPGALCRALTDAGLGGCPAAVGERLSYPDERVHRGIVLDFAGKSFAPLSVLLVRQPQTPSPAAANGGRRRLMIAAMGSGSGKTVLCCGLLAALRRRGIECDAFKCGPDYIDPMFHSRALGRPGRNVDLFLQGRDGLRRTLAHQERPFALIEGAMGYYDGLAGTSEASAWDIARAEEIPVLLALRPGGSGLSLAAQLRGMLSFRAPSRIVGLILTECRESLCAYLKPLLERETGLPVLGCLPPMAEAALESRHLGLLTAGEIPDLPARFDAVAAKLEETVDIDRLLALAAPAREAAPHREKPEPACVIAVARDEAFSFYYQDSLDALEEAGAALRFFSPLHDAALPPCGGLYLGGGYPELHAEALSRNLKMRESIRAAVIGGLPTVAECGGFLYLQESLEDTDGRVWPMAGALPGGGLRGDRLKRFGYAYLKPEADSLLFRAGETVPVHEFHYWDSSDKGEALPVQKPDGRSWRCGFVSSTLYAAFPHLHLGGDLPLAERFAAAARERGCL